MGSSIDSVSKYLTYLLTYRQDPLPIFSVPVNAFMLRRVPSGAVRAFPPSLARRDARAGSPVAPSSRFGTRTDMASRSRLLAIIGPPASEPTAYARLIANGLRCPTLSVGQMLATEVEHGTHAGLKVADFVAAHPGDLVPVPLVAPLVQQRLQQFPGADIVTLAGFPRSLQQWKALQTMGYSPELLHLNLSEELQRERLKSRRVCSACGWPAFDGHAMCECDAPTHRVSSDEGEHAEARLSAYAKHTRPLLEHLRGRGIAFHEVEVVADLAQMDEQVAAVVARS